MQVCVKWCFSLECDMSGANAHSIEKMTRLSSSMCRTISCLAVRWLLMTVTPSSRRSMTTFDGSRIDHSQ